MRLWLLFALVAGGALAERSQDEIERTGQY